MGGVLEGMETCCSVLVRKIQLSRSCEGEVVTHDPIDFVSSGFYRKLVCVFVKNRVVERDRRAET